MKTNYEKEQGLTLIEIMVVLAVIGVISTAIYNVYITGWKTWKFNQSRINLQQEARIAMLKMVKKTKKAIAIEKSRLPSELVFKWKENGNYFYGIYWKDDTKNTLYYKEIQLSEISEPGLDPTDNTDWPTDANWTNLGSKQPITTAIVDSITFTNEHENANNVIDLIKINLSLSQQPGGSGGQTYNLQNQVHLRNAK